VNFELLQAVLGWCALINIAILFIWWGAICCCGGWIYRMHQRPFRLTREQFDGIHYTLMGAYKLAILLFNVVPWIVLHLVR
jgi:fucose permease